MRPLGLALGSFLSILVALPVGASWHEELIYDHGWGITAIFDLDFARDGSLHLSLMQRPASMPGSNLAYAYREIGETPWTVHDLHWNPTMSEGSHNAIAVGMDDRPRLVYRLSEYGSGSGTLCHCWFTGSGWIQEELADPGEHLKGGPDIVAGAAGEAFVVWSESPAGIVMASDASGSWQSEIVIADHFTPRLSIARLGEDLFVGYLHRPGSSYVFKARLARRVDGVWSHALVDLQPDIDGELGIDLALDSAGRPHLVYLTDGSANYKLVHAWHDGADWNREDLVYSSSYAGRPRSPSIAAGLDGSLHVAYTEDYDNYNADLVILRHDGSAWSEDHRRAGENFECGRALIALDHRGRRHLIFHEDNSHETRHLWDDTPVVTTGLPSAAPSRVTRVLGNVPNPFNPWTEIIVDVSVAGPVAATVHAADGRRLRSLGRADREPGQWRLHWDGCDQRGADLPSGVYLVRVQARDTVATHKLLMLR